MRQNGETKSMLIREYVEQWEQEFGTDTIYDECLAAVRKIGLGDVSSLASTINRFLYVWGRMGRVLGRQEYRNWEERLKEQIESNVEKLEELKRMDLLTTPLESYEISIRACYDAVAKAVSPIAAVKILHLICPDFFPLWDNPIANAVREEREDGEYDKFSSGDYYHFMLDMQRFIAKHGQVLSELGSRFNRSKLRILDEFLWWITHRPLSVF
jgi:hypothetical protein